MKIAFPLSSKTELALDFAHSQFIGIFDDIDAVTKLIPVRGIENDLGINNFFYAMHSNGLHSVVSPYYSYMALRILKENNIETFKANGTDLSKNIHYYLNNLLEPFDMNESLFVGHCAKSCSSCDTECLGN